MKKELDVLNREVALPGCKLSRTAMEFERVDDATLEKAEAFLLTVEVSLQWWWGDYIIAYCKHQKNKLKADERVRVNAVPEDAERYQVRYTADIAARTGRAQNTLHQWGRVARSVEVWRRRQTLSWSHHREAVDAGGENGAVVDAWLLRAEKEGWKHSSMRAAIRAERRGAIDCGEVAARVSSDDLFAFRNWATKEIKAVDSMDVDDVDQLMKDLEVVAALIEKLKARRKKLDVIDVGCSSDDVVGPSR